MTRTLYTTLTAMLLAVVPSVANTNFRDMDHKELTSLANDIMHQQWHSETRIMDVHFGRFLNNECRGGELQAWADIVDHIITINSACKYWDKETIRLVLTHETGHLLMGPAHSLDKKSVMYFQMRRAPRCFFLPINYFGQKVTKEDRERLEASAKLQYN